MWKRVRQTLRGKKRSADPGERGRVTIEEKLGMPYASLPPTIPENDEVRAAIRAFRDRYGVAEALDTTISKNDLMFLTSLAVSGLADAFTSYLQVGLSGRNVIQKLAERKFGSLGELDGLLDFASGYGRLTRFLTLDMPADRIWVSDVKEQAVAFQTAQFGVHGILSSYEPEAFRPPRTFDFVFVGSLFSHLPEDLFTRWLRSLYGVLSERGVLAFSVHDVGLLEKRKPVDFAYKKFSEDLVFEVVEDSIKDGEVYGAAYVSERFVHGLLEREGIPADRCFRYEKAFGKRQDVYTLSREKSVFDDGLDLSSYP